MFKKNTKHLQPNLFGLLNSLPDNMQKKVKQSEEFHFYNLIFRNIKEDLFKPLFSDKESRPNSPINAMVSALLFMQRRTWTYEELFKQIQFHILVRIALGLDTLDEMPFCPATLFNFQNRLSDHFTKTGENLLEQVFDQLSDQQIKKLKIKTNIQRTDSFQAASNIRNYSRLQLLVELLIRIYRILSDDDKKRFKEQFDPYVDKTSGQYIYSLNASDLPHEMKKVGHLYHWIESNLKPAYKDKEIFKVFDRVFLEHFTISGEKIEVKSPDQLKSDSVQSPDDTDATYRRKQGKSHKGQSINIIETANPDNPINLITDVAINPNNKDDCKVIGERIDQLKVKTPDLDEIHFDGAYGSSDNDKKFKSQNINPIQTAVRGAKAEVELDIEQNSETEYEVSCPHQRVKSSVARKRYKATFDIEKCSTCPLKSNCPTLIMKKNRVLYFTHDDYLKRKRRKSILSIPEERRRLRNNVEATVNEFVCKMRKDKLKVRGLFKTSVFAYSVAISVNFGRIYRLIQENPSGLFLILLYFIRNVKERTLNLLKFSKEQNHVHQHHSLVLINESF
jgi:IS5 family transposase